MPTTTTTSEESIETTVEEVVEEIEVIEESDVVCDVNSDGEMVCTNDMGQVCEPDADFENFECSDPVDAEAECVINAETGIEECSAEEATATNESGASKDASTSAQTSSTASSASTDSTASTSTWDGWTVLEDGSKVEKKKEVKPVFTRPAV